MNELKTLLSHFDGNIPVEILSNDGVLYCGHISGYRPENADYSIYDIASWRCCTDYLTVEVDIY